MQPLSVQTNTVFILLSLLAPSMGLAAGFIDVDIVKDEAIQKGARVGLLAALSDEKALMPVKTHSDGYKPPSRIFIRSNHVAERAETFCKAYGFYYSTSSSIQDLMDPNQQIIVDHTLVPQLLPPPLEKVDLQSIRDSQGVIRNQNVKVKLPHSTFKRLICHGYIEDPKPTYDGQNYGTESPSTNSSSGTAR